MSSTSPLAPGIPPTRSAGVTAWSVWALLFGMGLLMIGNGMQGTLLGLRATDEAFSATVTGLVMSGYFVGLLGGAALAPTIIQRVGHVRVFAAMASIASVAIIIHAMYVTPWVWAGMRLVTGFAYCALFVVTESWLNDRASNEVRGRLLSIYLVITFVAMGGGQFLLNLASTDAYTLFLLNAIILSLALVPILLSGCSEPDRSAPDPLTLRQLYRISPLGTVGVFATGMAHGAVFGMAAVFARGLGLSVAQITVFMAALIAGGALLQWPIGRLSDRVDRRRVIVGVSLAVALIAGLTVPIAQASATGLMVMGLLFGGTVLPLYGLYVAHTNDHLKPTQMVAASGGLYKAIAVGAILGPSVTGWLMDLAGPVGFLWYFVATHLAMVAFTLYRMTRSAPVEVAEQSAYTPVAGQTGELAESWVQEVVEATPSQGPDTGRPPTRLP
jgi:MFS family permease